MWSRVLHCGVSLLLASQAALQVVQGRQPWLDFFQESAGWASALTEPDFAFHSKPHSTNEDFRLTSDLKAEDIAREARYDQHRLIHYASPSKDLMHMLEPLQHLDYWHVSASSLVLRVDTALYGELCKSKDALLRNFTVLNDNVQQAIDDETVRLQRSLAVDYTNKDPIEWFREYHDYDSIQNWFKSLAKGHGDLIEFIPTVHESLKTHEGRQIFAVRIGKKTGKPKKVFWMQSLQHAREWISGATTQYLTYKFLKQYDTDPAVTKLLNELDIFLVPVMNPDGYVYSWKSNRLWRKNRRRNNAFSWGVDLNRNWDDHWALIGSSNLTFSDTYHGPAAASEPEVAALQQAYLAQKGVIAGLDMHAYSQLILWPWGWTRKPYVYDAQHKTIGKEMARSIKAVHGLDYTPQTITDLYPASGSSADYFAGDTAMKHFGYRPYSFAMELRPDSKSKEGFLLNPSHIIPTGEEIFPCVMKLMQFALENPLGKDMDADMLTA